MPTVTMRDVTIAYDVAGNPDADPIVLICGCGQPALAWNVGIVRRAVNRIPVSRDGDRHHVATCSGPEAEERVVPITPNREQFAELATAASADDGPVVMLNLLKFKDTATSGGTGAASYNRYGDSVTRMVEERGGRILWSGRVDQVLIGEEAANGWDAIALVQYPSRQAFLDMVSDDTYLKSHEHREGGLADTVLLACTDRLPETSPT
jgi:uncharacterized protein (DUF1330 family)